MTEITKKKPHERGRPSLTGQPEKTPNRTLRVDERRWSHWKAAADRKGVPLAEWIRDTLDTAASSG